jgi:endonuclease YncB( thermonuclease family)
MLPINTEVTLTSEKIDLYLRTVSEVITKAGKVNVNKKMVELGMAVHYKFQKGCDEYAELEKVAKKSQKGVWADSSFVMPWDYREQQVSRPKLFFLNPTQYFIFNRFLNFKGYWLPRQKQGHNYYKKK